MFPSLISCFYLFFPKSKSTASFSDKFLCLSFSFPTVFVSVSILPSGECARSIYRAILFFSLTRLSLCIYKSICMFRLTQCTPFQSTLALIVFYFADDRCLFFLLFLMVPKCEVENQQTDERGKRG